MFILRNGMFETNSSSMHSIIIDKSDCSNCKSYASYCFYNKGQYGKAIYDLNSSDILNLDLGRQSAKFISDTSSKLLIFLLLLEKSCLDESSSIDEFNKRFSKAIEELNDKFFKDLEIELEVNPSEIMEGTGYQGNHIIYPAIFPFVEDSDFVFDTLWDKLISDKDTLFSFIFSDKSFILLLGDEYEGCSVITNIVKKGIDYDHDEIGGVLWG